MTLRLMTAQKQVFKESWSLILIPAPSLQNKINKNVTVTTWGPNYNHPNYLLVAVTLKPEIGLAEEWWCMIYWTNKLKCPCKVAFTAHARLWWAGEISLQQPKCLTALMTVKNLPSIWMVRSSTSQDDDDEEEDCSLKIITPLQLIYRYNWGQWCGVSCSCQWTSGWL
jgi:hypothetical protein